MNLIEEIKNKINIVDLTMQLGLKPTKNDQIFSIYKSEKNRSLKLYRKTNTFFCYATGNGGDVINFFADYKKIENREAIMQLAKELGLDNGYEKRSPSVQESGEKNIVNKINKERCIEIYHALENFCSGVDEITFQYLTGPKRGLTKEMIKKFRLFSIKDVNSTIDYLFTSYHIDELKEAGLFNESGKFVFTKHRLLIPYLEDAGIIYLRGRLLPEDENEKLGRYLGLTGKTAKRFFNSDVIKKLKDNAELLLCEGEFDAISAIQHGYPTVGLPGINNFPEYGKELLEKFDLYICFDNDEAGKKGMNEVAGLFDKEIKGVHLLKHKDITEVFSNNGAGGLLNAEVSTVITLNESGHDLPKLINAFELSNIELPDTNWIIQNLLPEGANLLAGKPKEGKTIIGMNIALAVAQGGKLFSYFNANKNGVLYLSYEDSLQRLQKRINIMKRIDFIEQLPKNLHFPMMPYEFPVLDEKGLKIIEGYLEMYKDIKLVIVDTLGRGIDPKVYTKGVTYAGEYGYNSMLHQFAHRNHISILIIHHTRKAPAENDFDEILGTTGIPGAMDNLFTLKKVNGNYIFHTKGRDVEEKEFRIKRVEESMSWVIEGENENIKLTEEKQEIVDLLKVTNVVMKSGQIAKELGKKVPNISKHLRALEKDSIVFPHGYGKYAIYPNDKESKSGKSSKALINQLDFDNSADSDE